jgi:hypothetical protein
MAPRSAYICGWPRPDRTRRCAGRAYPGSRSDSVPRTG